MKIEFVSYSGGYPNLCSGILVLRIDGKEHSFGYQDGCDAEPFWSSGGCAYIAGDGEEMVTHGKWGFSYCGDSKFVKENGEKLIRVFNRHVPYGCCGGCI